MCGKDTFWLLCGGRYKFLLRSAWIILAITTLIDIGAIIAYWQLALKSLDSKPGLKLSLLLLAAVLFLYFFAVLLCCLVIIKLSPRNQEPSREPTAVSRNRSSDGPAISFEPLPPSSIPYSDGFRRVLPNNASSRSLYGNSQRRTGFTEIPELPNRCTIVRESTTRSSIMIRNYPNAKDSDLNDNTIEKQSTPQTYVKIDTVVNVPEIVITEPEDFEPIYENIGKQSCQLPTSIQSNSSSSVSATVATLNQTSNLSQNYFHWSDMSQCPTGERPNLKMSMQQTKVDSGNTNSTVRPVLSGSESYVNRSITHQHYEDKRKALALSTYQTKIGSRRTVYNLARSESYIDRCVTNQCFEAKRKTTQLAKIDLSCTNGNSIVKPASYRSESFINKCHTEQSQADEKQMSLEMSMHQVKIDSRNTNGNFIVKPDVPVRSESYANRLHRNQRYADERQALEMPMHQAKTDSKRFNSNPTIKRDVSSVSKITGSEASEKFKSQSTIITRRTNSYIVKSQPVMKQPRRCTVDKLPPTSNRETQLLLKAVLESEDLFKRTDKQQTDCKVPEMVR